MVDKGKWKKERVVSGVSTHFSSITLGQRVSGGDGQTYENASLCLSKISPDLVTMPAGPFCALQHTAEWCSAKLRRKAVSSLRALYDAKMHLGAP